MDWRIVVDSSCDFYKLEDNDIGIKYSSVPFVISIDGKDFVDTKDLNKEELVDAMDACKETSLTSCPSPGTWMDAFGDEENVIVLTISSNLSGSYNGAVAGKEMALEENPNRNIEVIDTLTTGPEMCLAVKKIQKLIAKGLSFDEVVSKTKAYLKTTHIIFALSSYNNLIRNGRMPKVAGLVAGKLKLTGVGIGSEEGTIDIKKITRGDKRVVDTIINDIKTRGQEVKEVIITYCQNIELAENIRNVVLEIWDDVKVSIMPTSGLCSYYAERNGIIVGF